VGAGEAAEGTKAHLGGSGAGSLSAYGATEPRKGVPMAEKSLPVLMPSEVSSRIGFFDRFAGLAARLAAIGLETKESTSGNAK
jgi:hypothetical protein